MHTILISPENVKSESAQLTPGHHVDMVCNFNHKSQPLYLLVDKERVYFTAKLDRCLILSSVSKRCIVPQGIKMWYISLC